MKSFLFMQSHLTNVKIITQEVKMKIKLPKKEKKRKHFYYIRFIYYILSGILPNIQFLTHSSKACKVAGS